MNNKGYMFSDFIEYYNKKTREGHRTLSISEILNLINTIVYFFEFKYPNSLLNFIFNDNSNIDKTEAKKILNLSRKLDINQLKCRLSDNQLQFLECKYPSYLYIKTKVVSKDGLSFIGLTINENGNLCEEDLDALKQENIIKDVNSVITIEDLLEKINLEKINKDADYSDLETMVLQHKNEVELRNMVFSLIPYSLIYSDLDSIEYGYIRAKHFIRMFNKEFNLNLNLEQFENLKECSKELIHENKK